MAKIADSTLIVERNHLKFDSHCGVKVNPPDLISTDPNNELKLGTDSKLLVNPNPQQSTDIVAQYLLARGNL